MTITETEPAVDVGDDAGESAGPAMAPEVYGQGSRNILADGISSGDHKVIGRLWILGAMLFGLFTLVADLSTVTRRIVVYTVVLWALTIVFGPVADMGLIYLVAALGLGAVFFAYAVRVARTPEPKPAMALFGWSITYIVLLFGAMALDQLV